MTPQKADDMTTHPLFQALRKDEEARVVHESVAEDLRKFKIQQSAQWLREEIHQFLSPKENGLALRLVDLLEKEALKE